MDRRLTVDWAVLGKHAGAGDEYEITAVSRPELTRLAHSQIMRWSPGNPGRHETPPWITLGPVGTEGPEKALAVCVMEQTSERDETTRTIRRTRCFFIPFAPLATLQVSWRGLAGAALRTSLPLRGSTGPVELELKQENPARRLAEQLQGKSPRVLADTAARLLDDAVVLTNLGDKVWQDKLGILDAVAGMLPYGLRGSLPAGTWADPSAAHRLRLTISRRDPLRCTVSWTGKQQDPLPPLSPAAAAYKEFLLDIWERHEGRDVLEYLCGNEAARQWADIGADDASERALDLLRAMDKRAFVAHQVARRQNPTDADLEAALRSDHPDVATMLTVAAYAAELPHSRLPYEPLAQAMTKFPEALSKVREIIRARLKRCLVEPAAHLAHALHKEDPEAVDELLAQLLLDAAVGGEAAPTAPSVELLRHLGPFEEGTWPLTRIVVIRDREDVALEVLRREYLAGPQGEERGARWHEWLFPRDTDPYEAFAEALLPLDSMVPRPGGRVRALPPTWATVHRSAALVLFTAYAATGRTGLVLDVLWPLLVGLAVEEHPQPRVDPRPGIPEHGWPDGTSPRADGHPRAEEQGRWLREALDLPHKGNLSARQNAEYDVLRVLCHLPPTGFPPDEAWQPGPGSYSDALAAVLTGDHVRRSAGKAASGALAWALGVGGGEANPAAGERPLQSGCALALTLLNTPDQALRRAAEEAVLRLERLPHWPRKDRDTLWVREFEQRVPELRRRLRLRTLVHLVAQPRAAAEDLAGVLHDLRGDHVLTMAHLVEALRPWLERATGHDIHVLVESYRARGHGQEAYGGREAVRALQQEICWRGALSPTKRAAYTSVVRAEQTQRRGQIRQERERLEIEERWIQEELAFVEQLDTPREEPGGWPSGGSGY